MSEATPQAQRPRALPAVLIALSLGLIGAASVSMARSMGYDEAMHAELPAARMAVAAQMGEGSNFFDALLGCQQYPFGYPFLLACVQWIGGVSEFACRATGRMLWAFALLGIFLVARELVRGWPSKGAPGPSSLNWMPWIAMALAAISPLALSYSGTLFLEVPFTTVAVFATYAWLRRRADDQRSKPRADVIAGAMLALGLFTKFNYGGLLALGCALDFALEGVSALRSRTLGPWLRSAARIIAVPCLALLWWFGLPLPAGLETAASHRAAFLGFLGGNLDFKPTPYGERLFDWGVGLFLSPRLAILCGLAALLALRHWRARALQAVVILGACSIAPVAFHPFHEDRFLLPGAPFVWIAAALGICSVLPRSPRWRAGVLAGLALLCLTRADLDGQRLMDWSFPSAETRPEVLQYRRAILEERISLAPSRLLRTAGLAREESDAILDALAAEVGPEARVGWLAAVEKIPPGALQVGLLTRAGSRARLLEDPTGSMLFGVTGQDPAWDDARLAAACANFDVIIASDPPAALGAGPWKFLGDYRTRLTGTLGYTEREFAKVVLQPPLGTAREVRLLALRRSP